MFNPNIATKDLKTDWLMGKDHVIEETINLICKRIEALEEREKELEEL